LDLVEVAPGAKIPVCKVMDYNRYYFELKKKKKEEKKKSKSKQLKQIRMSPNIGKNDLKVKFNKITNFLDKGHNVKVNMFFRGRQREHLEVGREILAGIMKELEGRATYQSEPKFEGYSMSVLFRPENENGK
jgi:translation initiation factor IF-3